MEEVDGVERGFGAFVAGLVLRAMTADAIADRIGSATRTVTAGGITADTAHGGPMCDRRPFVHDSADMVLYAAAPVGR